MAHTTEEQQLRARFFKVLLEATLPLLPGSDCNTWSIGMPEPILLLPPGPSHEMTLEALIDAAQMLKEQCRQTRGRRMPFSVRLSLPPRQLSVTKTLDQVIVHHAPGLHACVADGTAYVRRRLTLSFNVRSSHCVAAVCSARTGNVIRKRPRPHIRSARMGLRLYVIAEDPTCSDSNGSSICWQWAKRRRSVPELWAV
jgi:hypothetical protein